jgi:hypothetical protein
MIQIKYFSFCNRAPYFKEVPYLKVLSKYYFNFLFFIFNGALTKRQFFILNPLKSEGVIFIPSFFTLTKISTTVTGYSIEHCC